MEAVQLIMEDPTFLQLQEAGLKIMNNPESLMKCVMQDFNIKCRDDKKVSFLIQGWLPLAVSKLFSSEATLLFTLSVRQSARHSVRNAMVETWLSLYSIYFHQDLSIDS